MPYQTQYFREYNFPIAIQNSTKETKLIARMRLCTVYRSLWWNWASKSHVSVATRIKKKKQNSRAIFLSRLPINLAENRLAEKIHADLTYDRLLLRVGEFEKIEFGKF